MSNEELVKLIQHGTDPAGNMGQLYIQNKGLIFAVIKKYRYACQADYNSTPIIELDELMNESYFGLVRAVEGYDLSQGTLFMSYATFWIRQAVKSFLDNSGQVIRVPVHKQEQIYKYNQVSSYYLRKYNRQATTKEYAMWLGVSEKVIDKLEEFMFNKTVKSLDAILPGEDNDNMTVGDTVASGTDLENDIVERIAQEQLHAELWDMVKEVLQHDKMNAAICYRFKEGLTLEESAKRMGITRELVRQYESKALRRLRCNSRTKKLINCLVA